MEIVVPVDRVLYKSVEAACLRSSVPNTSDDRFPSFNVTGEELDDSPLR